MSFTVIFMIMSVTLPISTVVAQNTYGWIITNISNLHPENLDWNPISDAFITGTGDGFGNLYSYTLATNAKIFSNLTYPLFGTGVQVDFKRDLLYHTQVNESILLQTYTSGVQSVFNRVNLTTGQVISYVDFSNYTTGATPTFLNDIIMDSVGNVYLTDSINEQLYIIYPNNTFEVFFRTPLFNLTPGGIAAADGIDIYNDSILIVSKFDSGELFRIPISNPSAITKISLDKQIGDPDGIFLDHSQQNLYVAGNLHPNGQFYIITSTDGWFSATVVNYTDPLSDTAGVTLKNGTISYVCHLNFFGGNPNSYVIEPIPPIFPPTPAPTPSPTPPPTPKSTGFNVILSISTFIVVVLGILLF